MNVNSAFPVSEGGAAAFHEPRPLDGRAELLLSHNPKAARQRRPTRFMAPIRVQVLEVPSAHEPWQNQLGWRCRGESFSPRSQRPATGMLRAVWSQSWLCALLLWLSMIPARAAEATPPQLNSIPAGQPFTFAVLGDNRGDDSGAQPAAFGQILRAVNEAGPAFVVNTGDMIYGHTADEAVAREHWRLYRAVTTSLQAPLFHLAGNHDIWNEMSARLYRELCGPAYLAFDYGPAKFILLDGETIPSRLGKAQFDWLEKQLQGVGRRAVFVFLHRPLFPVDGALGSSMDAFPKDRDRLHRLLVRHRHQIKGVFLGHEHLYHFRQREGVPYYITGGAGAPLYMAPELGGFHHFLLVRVTADKVVVELKKVGPPVNPLLPAKRLAAGELLESWEQGLFWYAWDYTVTTELTSDHASEGRRGLQLNFDLAQCPWPVLSLPLPTPWKLGDYTAFSVDVYLPAALPGRFALIPGVETQAKHEARPVPLQLGWNTVRADLEGAWLPAQGRGLVHGLGWNLLAESNSTLRGSVAFDNFRVERRGGRAAPPAGELWEGWERPWWWRVTDESVHAETTPQLATEGRCGLRVFFDFARCPRPTLLARLNPPWDLTAAGALAVDVFVPDNISARMSVFLALRAREAEFIAPPAALRRGWNKVRIPLTGGWLPQEVRAAVEQVEWILGSANPTLRGWAVFDRLHTP
jgi:hypothetical protein